MVAELSQALPNIDEVAVLSGHSDEIWNIAWSYDGARLASARKDRAVVIWEIQVRIRMIGST